MSARVLRFGALLLALALLLPGAQLVAAPSFTGPYTPPKARIQTTALCISAGGATRSNGGYTVGGIFNLTAPGRLVGARFAWKLASEAVPETAKICLWDANGTRVECVSQSVTASGAQSVTFATVHTIGAFSPFTLSTYSAGGKYMTWAISGLPSGVRDPGFAAAYTAGASLYLGNGVSWVDGVYSDSIADKFPDQRNAPAGQMFDIDPVLVGDP